MASFPVFDTIQLSIRQALRAKGLFWMFGVLLILTNPDLTGWDAFEGIPALDLGHASADSQPVSPEEARVDAVLGNMFWFGFGQGPARIVEALAPNAPAALTTLLQIAGAFLFLLSLQIVLAGFLPALYDLQVRTLRGEQVRWRSLKWGGQRFAPVFVIVSLGVSIVFAGRLWIVARGATVENFQAVLISISLIYFFCSMAARACVIEGLSVWKSFARSIQIVWRYAWSFIALSAVLGVVSALAALCTFVTLFTGLLFVVPIALSITSMAQTQAYLLCQNAPRPRLQFSPEGKVEAC